MKLHDLVKIHYFHDSSLNDVQYDPKQRRIEISVVFCNWMQDYFVEGMPELIAVKLVFTNVSRYFDDELGQINEDFGFLDGNPILDESGAPVIDDEGNAGVCFIIDRGFSERPSFVEIYAQDVEFIDMGPVVYDD